MYKMFRTSEQLTNWKDFIKVSYVHFQRKKDTMTDLGPTHYEACREGGKV